MRGGVVSNIQQHIDTVITKSELREAYGKGNFKQDIEDILQSIPSKEGKVSDVYMNLADIIGTELELAKSHKSVVDRILRASKEAILTFGGEEYV